MNKENDLFLNMLYNPDMSLKDFAEVGMTADNTGIDTIDSYRNSKKVKETFSTPTGQFDEAAFQKAYNIAKQTYNMFANFDYDDAVIKSGTFHRDNIFAPKQTLRSGPDLGAPIKIINPLKQQGGIVELGKLEDPTQSVREIAESQQVFDPATGEWLDSPETNSGLPYFFDTLVLASWDEDGTHVDPETGETVEHKIGDLKLNDNGTYYYEKLNGRPVYNKQVLNKMDVLTKEGSALNKYDFFDSDDLHKSAFGTVMKNVALIAPMFIPYVGPWIAGASVLSQSVGFMATLGKMFTGSDSPTLSNIEGWSKSVNRQTSKSDYAQENTWCWENFIDLIGDVVGQLKEQRFIFKDVPALFMGAAGRTEKGISAMKATLMDANLKEGKETLNELIKSKSQKLLNEGFDYFAEASKMKNAAASRAAKTVDDYIKSYNKIGSVLSKTYMTMITTQDMYGEAKLAGASDLEATLLTIGYTAAEAVLLNTGIGEHVLPELREQGIHNKALIKALVGKLPKYTKGQDKQAYVKKLFNMGKNLYQQGVNANSGVKQLGAQMFAHGLGEGIEEVSEELLADFARSCYNASQWIQGDDSRLKIDNVFDRYTMSFLGGIAGGAINAPFMGYKSMKQNNNITSKQALQEIIYMIRNGNIEDFKKSVKNMPIGNKNLSATSFSTDENGNTVWDTAKNYEDSQDYQAKKMIYDTIDNIQNMLQAEGGTLTDETFLDKQTLGDLRFQELQSTLTAAKYLEDYQDTMVKIHDTLNELSNLGEQTSLNESEEKTDRQKLQEEKESNTKEKNNRIQELNKQLSELRKTQQSLVNGDRSTDFIGSSLFEMIPAINSAFIKTNFVQYAEHAENKKFDDITNARKKELYTKYDNWRQTEAKNQIFDAYTIFKDVLKKSSKTLSEVDKSLLKNPFGIDLAKFYHNVNLGLVNYESTQDVNGQPLDPIKIAQSAINDKEFLINLFQLQGKYPLNDSEPLINNVLPKLQDIVKQVRNGAFIPSELKTRLIDSIINLEQQASAESDKYFEDQMDDKGQLYTNLANSLTDIRVELKSAKDSPIIDLLNQFSTDVQGIQFNLQQVIDNINNSLKSKKENITEFILDSKLQKQVDYALDTIEALKSVVNATKTDSLGFGTTVKNGEIVDNTDLWGYTKTMNEIDPDAKLVEMDTKSANIILNDLQTTENKLKILKNLSALNNGQKLNRQFNIDLNQTYIFRNKLNKFIHNIPDDWNKKQELISAINQSLLSKYSDSKTFDISNDERTEIKKEYIQLQDAIYDFFKSNNDKDLSLIINPETLSLTNNVSQILNEKTDDLDDNSFIWWLASRASVKASDFYSLYAKSMLDGIAPIPSQELAIYTAFSFVVNGPEFQKFYDTYRKSFLEYYKNKTVDERREILKKLHLEQYDILAQDKNVNYINTLGLTPVYSRINFIEGIAGSGKTSAVISQVVNMIKNVKDQKLLNNVYVVHGANKQSGIELANNIGFKEDQVYSKEEFLQEIINSWKNYKDPSGKLTITNDDIYLDDEYSIRGKGDINALSKPPSLVIIDEISQFTTNDLDLLEKSAKKYGFKIITAGDLDQSKSFAEVNFNIDSQNIKVSIGLQRELFIRCPKLGSSMRTNNSQKNQNQITLINAIQQNSKQFELHHYINQSGFNGDKIYHTLKDGEFTKTSVSDDFASIKQEVDAMIKTLPTNEKIGFIYTKTDTPLYKWLSETYKDKIEFFADNTAQGKEATYFIAELDENNPMFQNELYTAVTRSKKGSIIVANQNDNFKIRNIKDETTIKDELTESAIKNYTNKVKDLYAKLNLQGSDIKIVEDNKSEESVSKPVPSGAQPTSVPGTIVVTPPSKPTIQSSKPQLSSGTSSANTNEFTKLPDNITTNVNGSDVIISLVDIPFVNSNNESALNKAVLLSGDVVVLIDLNSIRIPFVFKDGNWKPVFGFSQDAEVVTADINDNTLTNISNALLSNLQEAIKAPEASQESIDWMNGDLIKINSEDPNYTYALNNNIDFILNSIEQIFNREDEEPWIFTNDDTSTDDELKIKTDVLSQDNEPVSESNNDVLKMLLYSFNTFESGVTFDQNGKMITHEGEGRRDSINGLKNIESKYNKIFGVSFDEYMKYIGTLRSILLTQSDKNKMLSDIATILQIQNPYITFAYKKSVKPGEKSGNSTYNLFTHDENERLNYIYTDTDESKKVQRGSLIAIIGDQKNGDLLEIPLLSFVNPATIIQLISNGEYVYKEELNAFNNGGNKIEDKYKALENYLKANKPNSDLYYLTKLFNMTQNAIFYIDKYSGFANFENWTPASYFENLGPLMVLNKGNKNIVDYLGYSAKWVNLNEFAKNPAINMSKILSSKSATIDGIKNIVQPGHPFVLVSYDKSITNLLDYYILQEQGKKPKQVKLMYVVSPSYSLKEYIDNIHKIITKQSDKKPIGQINSTYKVLTEIINNDSLKQLAQKLYPEAYDKIVQAITELDILQQQIDKANTVEEKTKLLQKFYTRLMTYEDWSDVLFSKESMLYQHLDRFLSGLVYVENRGGTRSEKPYIYTKQNQDLLDSITSINTFRLRSIKPIEQQTSYLHNVVFEVEQNDYQYDSRHYLIHGKVDSNVFKGNIHSFLKNLIKNKLKYDKIRNMYYSLDTKNYIAGKSMLNQQSNNLPNYIQNVIDMIESLGYNNLTIDKSNPDSIIQSIAQQINIQGNVIAIPFTDCLLVSDKLDIFKNKQILLKSLNGEIINSVTNTRTLQNTYEFRIDLVDPNTSKIETFNAKFYNNGTKDTLELTPILAQQTNTQSVIQANLNITIDEFENNFDLLNSIFEGEQTDDINDFKETLDDYLSDEEEANHIKDVLNELINNANSPEIKSLLMKVQQYIDEKLKQDNEDQQNNTSCPKIISIDF